MSELNSPLSSEPNLKDACDDWTKIPVHCAECGVQFLRKVKHQKYCDEHRHLAGAVIRPMTAPEQPSSKPVFADAAKELRYLLDCASRQKLTNAAFQWDHIKLLADEIERLRAELAKPPSSREPPHCSTCCCGIKASCGDPRCV